jgi:hypothetical protein
MRNQNSSQKPKGSKVIQESALQVDQQLSVRCGTFVPGAQNLKAANLVLDKGIVECGTGRTEVTGNCVSVPRNPFFRRGRGLV